jgi:hypothetical protein
MGCVWADREAIRWDNFGVESAAPTTVSAPEAVCTHRDPLIGGLALAAAAV